MKKTQAIDLRKVKASDLMQSKVVTLSHDAPVEEAIATLEEYGVSGAPVVDSGGNLVGVLSASDVAKREHLAEAAGTGRVSYYAADPLDDEEEGFPLEDYDLESFDRQRVRDWMTPNVVSIRPDDSLQKACAVMARESIHRVLVVEEGALRGILSSFDVVRYLAENS